jgi:hypothetical protein
MTEQQRLEQLATVTSIIQQDLPWEWRDNAGHWRNPETSLFTVLAWENPIRIKPTVTLIPLDPSGIPPGSVISRNPTNCWFSIVWLGLNQIQYIGPGRANTITFTELHDDNWQINRSIPLLGKWDPTAWEPCSKPSTTNPTPP